MSGEKRSDAKAPPVGGSEPSKLLEKRARRQERASRLKKGRDWTRITYASIIVVLALGGLGALIYANNPPPAKVIQPAAGAAQEVGERMPVQPGLHISPPQRGQYATDPPTSGPHYSLRGQAPTAWGFYDHAVEPEYWVHNLEHGGVVILYNCPPQPSSSGAKLVEGGTSSCPDDQRKISDFVSAAPKDSLFQEVKIVAAEYPVPGHRFAIVAGAGACSWIPGMTPRRNASMKRMWIMAPNGSRRLVRDDLQ